MMLTSLIIVADRGSLKAYRVEQNPTPRLPRVSLLQTQEWAEARGRTQDQLTDFAGRFGARESAGAPGGAGTADQPSLEIENDRRAIKKVAETVSKIVAEQEKSAGWSLAAPASISKLLLSHLAPEARQRLVDDVHADLVHLDPNKLLEHFPSFERILNRNV